MTIELPYDPEEVYELIQELILVLRADIVHKGTKKWLDVCDTENHVGEWPRAYEGICNLLFFNHVLINERIYGMIERTGEALTVFDAELWERLKPLMR